MKPTPAIAVLVLSSMAAAQQPGQPSVGEERVEVILMQIDALVVDKDGKTVAGLGKDDFKLRIAGRPLAVSTVDFNCPIGPSTDPKPLETGDAPPPPLAPGVKRRVVFAFDYSLLSIPMRAQVLDAAAWMLSWGKPPDEEVMIVALANEVRIEQKFTSDPKRLALALSRMKHDVTLWARDFPIGVSGQGYFGKIETLMDVLAAYPGSKAVIYFSQADVVPAAMQDIFHNEVAAHAAAARTAIYPAKPDLLESASAGGTLARLANQTGGRMAFFGNDVSVPYRQAQRDLLCRYTIGTYVDPKETDDPRNLSVSVVRPGLSIRAPEQLQIFTEDEKRQARAAAAYVDPEPYERPLVRAYAYPALPASSSKWDTMLAVNFPAPVGASGADVAVRAALRRDNAIVREYDRKVHVDPAAGEVTTKPVTVLGRAKLAAGQYDLTVVLAGKKGEIVTARTDFLVPEVVPNTLTVRGPLLGRVVAGGQFFRADPDDKPGLSRLGKALGSDNGFEPLLVASIEKNDKLLSYWSACIYGDNPLEGDMTVARAFTPWTEGSAKSFDPVPLKLESRGKGVSCIDMLETVEPGTLAAGDYTLDVTVKQANGDVFAQGTTPLNVR